MVSDSFLATSASNAVAFASDRNRKCHIICPCVTKSVWQLTSRPVTEGPEALQNGPWLLGAEQAHCSRLHCTYARRNAQARPDHRHQGADGLSPSSSFVWEVLPITSSLGAVSKIAVICLNTMAENGVLIGSTHHPTLCTQPRCWLCFCSLTQMSLKGSQASEADTLPVGLLEAQLLDMAAGHR